jgi:hypothetical protein
MPATATAPERRPKTIKNSKGSRIGRVLVQARDTSIKGVALFTPPAEAIVKGWITAHGLTPKQVADKSGATVDQIRNLIRRKKWNKQGHELAAKVDLISKDTFDKAAEVYAQDLDRIAKRSIKVASSSIAAASKAKPGQRLNMVKEASGALSIFRDSSGTGKGDGTSPTTIALHLHAHAWGNPVAVPVPGTVRTASPEASAAIDVDSSPVPEA